jgi:hypothetical protein
MKKLIVTGALLLSMIFTLGLGSNATAAGRAAGLLVSIGEASSVVLIDFYQNDFTQIEAQQLSVVLQLGAALLPSLLSQRGINISVNVVVFTPALMTTWGLGDAEQANTYIVNNFAALGVGGYIKAVATKVDPPQGVTGGQNIRLDLHQLNATDSSFQYVASLEVPEQSIDQLLSF